MDEIELQFKNTNGPVAAPHVTSVTWTDESELNLELVLEDIRKRPAKIQNDGQAEIYSQKMTVLRDAERTVAKVVSEAVAPFKRIAALITGAPKGILDELANESKAILAELNRWTAIKRSGATQNKSRALAKAQEQERKATTGLTKKERDDAAKKAKDLYSEAAKEAKEEKKATHGIAIVDRWVGEMIDPIAYFKEHKYRSAKQKFVSSLNLDAGAINEHCKEIIKNGGKIDARTIPGIALRKETSTQYRG